MIEYALKDIDDNEFNLNDNVVFGTVALNSLTSDVDPFVWENKIVEKSSLPGSVKLGKSRLQSRTLTFHYTRAVGSDSDAFREDENTLLMWLDKAVYLLDKTNLLQIPISAETHDILYDLGGHKISGGGTFTVFLLDPFWEAVTAQTDVTVVPAAQTDIALDNDGFLKAPPVFTLVATAATNSVQLSVVETNEGLEILDSVFGTTGFTQMDIDCNAGTVLIGDLDRRNQITAGTGFFQFPVGSFTLRVTPAVQITVTTDWKERYYL